VAGYSAYTQFLDYAKFREIADENSSYLMADMAHIGGLVAAGLVPQSPFDYCDIVTTTIHKTLRGPRSALLFFRKSTPLNPNLGVEMNNAVFPGHLGGPHNHTISAVATCLHQANSQEFVDYQSQVLKNSKLMSEMFLEKGYKLMTGGTENHMILMTLKGQGVDGAQVEFLLNEMDITINKNTVKGDTSALRPSGLRLGSPPMTTRGCKEQEFKEIVDFVHEGIQITKDLSKEGEKLVTFKNRIKKAKKESNMVSFKNRVNEFSNKLDFNFSEDMI
jgi:glycine hydroxymethyltransferase